MSAVSMFLWAVFVVGMILAIQGRIRAARAEATATRQDQNLRD